MSFAYVNINLMIFRYFSCTSMTYHHTSNDKEMKKEVLGLVYWKMQMVKKEKKKDEYGDQVYL